MDFFCVFCGPVENSGPGFLSILAAVVLVCQCATLKIRPFFGCLSVDPGSAVLGFWLAFFGACGNVENFCGKLRTSVFASIKKDRLFWRSWRVFLCGFLKWQSVKLWRRRFLCATERRRSFRFLFGAKNRGGVWVAGPLVFCGSVCGLDRSLVKENRAVPGRLDSVPFLFRCASCFCSCHFFAFLWLLCAGLCRPALPASVVVYKMLSG